MTSAKEQPIEDDCEKSSETGIRNSNNPIKLGSMVDEILSLTKQSSIKPTNRKLRNDVVNKNILRIVSRFLKSQLMKFVPNYAEYLKSQSDLEILLNTFINKLLPLHSQKDNLKYVLGAFVIGNSMLKLQLQTTMMSEVKDIVECIHHCLSKYTLTSLKKIFKNSYAK